MIRIEYGDESGKNEEASERPKPVSEARPTTQEKSDKRTPAAASAERTAPVAPAETPNHRCAHTRIPAAGAISFPGTYGAGSKWKLYNHLIGGIPDGILVRDYCLGQHWSYVEADCGMGVGWTAHGGAQRGFTHDLRGHELREVAELSKSWCFEEATLGVAALNAWYSRPGLIEAAGATYDDELAATQPGKPADAFDRYRPAIEAAGGKARVVVVGHFPHVAGIADYARLTVLERNCRDGLDTPDPACEYVLPEADFAFITGVTLINKTAPRLLDLARDATTVMVGPSVVMSPFLLKWGVDALCGSVVADPEKTRFAVKNGAGKLFGEALRMTTLQSAQR